MACTFDYQNPDPGDGSALRRDGPEEHPARGAPHSTCRAIYQSERKPSCDVGRSKELFSGDTQLSGPVSSGLMQRRIWFPAG